MSKHHKGLSVAVIGIGCVFPKSVGLHEYWRLLYHGEDAVTEVPSTHWSKDDYFDSDPGRPDHTYCSRGGYIPAVDFDPTEFGIPPANLDATDSSQLLGLVAANMALNDAGYGKDGKPFDRDRTSVILGVTGTQELVIPLGARLGFPKWRRALESAGVAPATTQDVMDRISADYVEWKENSFPGLLGNVVAGRISNRLDLNGTNCVVDAACASSMSALHLALLELSSGRSDMVLTGGIDSLNDIFMHMCFAKTHILSPSGDARPFSADADGTVLGEGIGIVLLKKLNLAEKDGDRIYAVIRGIGTSSDGKSQSIYAPRAEGQAKALKMAYDSADIDPATVGLVEAHGTGTRVGDMVEFTALKQVFGQTPANGHRCAIGSVKSMIGHTKAAAGSAGLIKTILALYHKVLPPTLKVTSPDPKLEIDKSPFYLNTETRPWFTENGTPRRAGVSAFGFGGSNFHTVLEEYQPGKQEPAWDGSVQLMALSADSQAALGSRLDQLAAQIKAAPNRQHISRIAAESRTAFESSDPHRLTFLIDREAMLNETWSERLDEVVRIWQSRDDQPVGNDHVKKMFYGGPDQPGRLAFVFPGQGSQYVGMGRDLVSLFPEAFKILQDAAALDLEDKAMVDILFPEPTLSAEEKQAVSASLQRTDIAQPAIGAVSLAMLAILRHFNVTPDSLCGHSFGELTALQAAGWLDERQLLNLAHARGRCMAAAGGGSMLAVRAELQQLAAFLTDHELDLVLANRNSPEQGVLSGSDTEIDRAEKLLAQAGLRSIRLPVAAAFHSPLMHQAQKPFSAVLNQITLTPGTIPVYANTTAQPYPDDAGRAIGLLSDQLLNPVDFVGCIERMYNDGVRTFVEVGPKKVLTGLIGSILNNREFRSIALDASAGRRFGISDLAAVIGCLASAGYPVNLNRWESTNRSLSASKMRIPICGANYIDPKRHQKLTAKRTPKAAEASFKKDAPVQPPVSAAPSVNHHPKTEIMPMQTKKPTAANINAVASAMAAVREGLRSMQHLQEQTAAAHQKFLETQQEASRTLQSMLASVQRMTAGSEGMPLAENQPIAPAMTRDDTIQPPVSAPDTPLPEPDTHPLGPAVVNAPVPESAQPLPEAGTVPPRPVVSANAGVKQALLEVVSDLTGYPVDMIGLEMDIESDLGIDSIKRVEILSALEEKLPDLPAVAPETMGTLKTLAQIMETLETDPDNGSQSVRNRDIPASEAEVALQPSAASMATADAQALTDALLEVVSQLTGYPADMIGPDMDIESDLGIDSIKRVEILSALEARLPELPTIAPDVMGGLKTLNQIVEVMSGAGQRSEPQAAPPRDGLGFDPAVRPETGGAPDDIRDVMLTVVSELTGYPVDMIDMDMDIESDLGIDSIKRVEILSTMEARVPNLPTVPPEVMGSLKTLGQIAACLATDHAPADPAAARDADSQSPATPIEAIAQKDLEHSTVPRGIITTVACEPAKTEALDLPVDRKVFITDDRTGLAQSLADRLAHRNINTVIVSTDILRYKTTLPKAAGLIMIEDPESPHPADDLQQAFLLAQHLAPSLLESAAAAGAFFGTLTRLDGAFGFKGAGVQRPLAGALGGLVKTAAAEWTGVHCKAIDLDPDWKDLDTIAGAVADELLYSDPGASLEIGLNPDQRLELHLEPAPIAPHSNVNTRIAPEDVIVISGGARGVTAAAACALAEKTGACLALLGRSAAPESEPAWLEILTEEAEIKKAILDHDFDEQKPTPKALEAAYRARMNNREIRNNLERIRSTGSKVAYHAVDIRDADQVGAVLDNVRRTLGPLRGFIHGAGVLEDRLILDKTPEQFENVFSTKVEGLEALLQATADDDLHTMVFFSSVAARFGNKGQVDYAMANEALNKIAQQQAVERPNCRVVSINWGPWDGGMVTPALKREFERNGIGLIPLKAGAQALLEELARVDDNPVEVVLGANLPSESRRLTSKPEATPQPVEAAANKDLDLAFKRHVDVQGYPVLGDHVLDGKPVVPLALMSEWFGHSALHGNPGLHLQGLEDVRVLKGIKLDQEQKLVRLFAGKARRSGKVYEVDLEIRDGVAAGVDVVHSKARAVLTDQLAEAPAFDPVDLDQLKPYSRSIDEVYNQILFHGSALRGIRAIRHLDRDKMVADIAPAPSPADWMKEPMRNRWLTDPLVLDSAFQMAIVWSFEETGKLSLPIYFSAYRQYRRAFPKDAVTAVMAVTSVDDKKLKSNFTFLDRDRKVIAQLTGYEAIMDPGLQKAFRQQDSAAPQQIKSSGLTR